MGRAIFAPLSAAFIAMTGLAQMHGLILFPYAGDTRGGSVHSSYLLVEELLRRGRPLALAFHGTGFARDLALARGFPTIDMAPLGSLAERARKDGFRTGNVTAAFSCLRVISRNGVRVVHVNDKRMLRTWCVASRLSGRTLIAHWRSVYDPSWSVDLGLRTSSRIVCVSQYSRDLLPQWTAAKSEVVYNPFKAPFAAAERPRIRAEIRTKAGIPAEAAVIGFVGALLERKRPHILLKLLKRIEKTEDGRPVYGVVCGETLEPHDKEYFRMLRAEDWHGRVIAPGFVDNAPEWMAACDVLVAPAIDEPLARVGVEAQSIGLPVMVSSDGGLREVVEHGVSGLVVEPDDFESWVDGVGRILNRSDVMQRLSEGGLAAAAGLTVKQHADAIEAIYGRLAPGKAQAASL
jgi:glycosyltransferase involved in cell wall biosynthesis